MQEFTIFNKTETNIKSVIKDPVKDLVVITTPKYTPVKINSDIDKEIAEPLFTDSNIKEIMETSNLFNNSKNQLDRATKYFNSSQINLEVAKIELENSEFKMYKATEVHNNAKNELLNATSELNKAKFELMQAEAKTNKAKEDLKILMKQYQEMIATNNSNNKKLLNLMYKMIFGFGIISSILSAYYFGRISNSNDIKVDKFKTESTSNLANKQSEQKPNLDFKFQELDKNILQHINHFQKIK